MLISLFLLALPLMGNVESTLQEANASVQLGEKATAYEERMSALSHALYLYSQMQSEMSSPALNRVIGDLYFQLGEYSWAVLYYQRTLRDAPNDPRALTHLRMAQQKLGIADSSPAPKQQHALKKLFSALAKQKSFYFWAIILTFLICSLSIWFPYRLIHKMAACSAFALVLLLLNSIVFYYTAPLEGILIAPTGFYRAPDKNQPQLTTVPLFAGSKVDVLQTAADGDWIKIKSSEGLVGFIPSTSFRLI